MQTSFLFWHVRQEIATVRNCICRQEELTRQESLLASVMVAQRRRQDGKMERPRAEPEKSVQGICTGVGATDPVNEPVKDRAGPAGEGSYSCGQGKAKRPLWCWTGTGILLFNIEKQENKHGHKHVRRVGTAQEGGPKQQEESW